MIESRLRSELPARTEKVLLVDDDGTVRTVIGALLRRTGYHVLEAGDGGSAVRLAAEEQPALVILDVNMPVLDGFAALEQMRARGLAMPVLMLSTEGEVDRRIKGLGLGADDFMAKPFDLRELKARVATLLRRGAGTKAVPRRLQRGEITVDLGEKRAQRAGEPLALTNTEFSILEVLARAGGSPVSKEELLRAVLGYTEAMNTRTIETHIWRLRKKLGEVAGKTGWIQNRAGLGYALEPTPGGGATEGEIDPGLMPAEALGSGVRGR